MHFEAGQTILQAALAAGVFIPHLCFHPDFGPHASCKLCTVTVDGRNCSACAMPAMPGQEVHSDTPELNARRRVLLQMLFVEGNHFCPGCAKSGNCKLQALGYELEMFNAHYAHFYPSPRARCLASRRYSGPQPLHHVRNSACGRAGTSTARTSSRWRAAAAPRTSSSIRLRANSATPNLALTDKAAHVCPVGALMPKRVGYSVPIGERLFDHESLRVKVKKHTEWRSSSAERDSAAEDSRSSGAERDSAAKELTNGSLAVNSVKEG